MPFFLGYIFSLQGGEHHAKKHPETGSVQRRIRIQGYHQDPPRQDDIPVPGSQRLHLHHNRLLLYRPKPGQGQERHATVPNRKSYGRFNSPPRTYWQ